MQKSLFKNINYIILILTLVTSFITNAQEVRVIDNKGTIQQIRNNQVTTSATAPINPLEGDVWYDTSGNTTVTKTYDGTSWVANFTNVYTGFFIIDNTTLTTTGTYSQSITSLPFQPSQITFVAHTNIGSFNINDDNATGNNNTNLLENTAGTMNGFARNDSGTINQAVIFIGAHGNSINDISRYSNNTQCIGLRYTTQNGDNNGVISASLSTFDTNGFTINVTYTEGTFGNAGVQDDILDESVIVLYTAYR
ncbi:hypothetical protein ACFQ1Q_07975 [Winogradskyella litorisediminis]|uniref:Uncharacterized protein n=1 Tax=Winogradskyella litorisediminis TaxID=1156618 RepID=A0ABW3N661_9FLAO